MSAIEQRRADAANALGRRLIDWLAEQTFSGIAEDDLEGVVVAALVVTASAFAAGRCVDAAANVALIHCIAESAAADIYGPTA